jgi:hypothetical protein
MKASQQDDHLKKVLIVTYYWPPSGGSGVQRWLKFVKYLPSFGWEPYVFTPENPAFEIRDDTLLKDVPAEAEIIRFPIWEPYGLFRKASGMLGKKVPGQTDLVTTGKRTFFQSVATWIRGNLFIPDARIFWVKPSVEFLDDFLKSNSIYTIITTGPPHSLHLIGMKLKKKNPSLQWIADFRDPWSEWDFLDTLSPSGWARRKHQRLEREVLQQADRVITIAPYHVARFEQSGGRKVDLITNGFDEADFSGIERVRTSLFTIRHIGMVDELRDPRPFMEALKQLMEEQTEFAKQIKLEFIGSVNTAFRDFVSQDSSLSSVTSFCKPIPHDALIKTYGETDLQLLVLAHTPLAPGNLPGKIFEYLASGNFVLGIGPPEGDAAHILRATHAGETVDRENIRRIKEIVLQRFRAWQGRVPEATRNVEAFSRRRLTEELSSLLGN